MLIPGARAHDYGRQPADSLFASIAGDGFQSIMLAMQKALPGISSYFDVTDEEKETVLRARKRSGLFLNTLGVYMELGLCDEPRRRAAAEQFIRGMEVASSMGIPQVATETTSFAKQPDCTPRDAMNALHRSLEQVLPRAEELGVTICIEPVYYHTLSSAALARQLMDDMGSRALRVTFDPVNLLAPELVEGQDALWKQVFSLVGEDIRVVHMKGVRPNGSVMESVPFGESVLHYEGIFELLRTLPGELPVIREEVKPASGADDAAFLRHLCAE